MDFYEKWDLIESPLFEFYLHELNEGFYGLKILLKDIGPSNKILEIFYSSFLSYRVTEESGRLKTLYENNSLGAYNIAKDSSFLRWFNEESHGLFSEEVLLHYNIISSNKIIDVVSSHPPVVKWL